MSGHGSPTIRRFVRSAWTLLAFQLVAAAGAGAVTIWAASEVRQLINQRDMLMARVAELEARRPPAVEENPGAPPDIVETPAEPDPILPAPPPVTRLAPARPGPRAAEPQPEPLPPPPPEIDDRADPPASKPPPVDQPPRTRPPRTRVPVDAVPIRPRPRPDTDDPPRDTPPRQRPATPPSRTPTRVPATNAPNIRGATTTTPNGQATQPARTGTDPGRRRRPPSDDNPQTVPR